MNHNTLLIASEDQCELAGLLRKMNLPRLRIECLEKSTVENMDKHAPNIILGDPHLVATIIDRFQSVKWVQSTFAGIERLCASDVRKNYVLTGVKNVFGKYMREYVFGYILAIERNILQLRLDQTDLRWRKQEYRSLEGLTIAVAGLGSIGTAIADAASTFGMKVVGMRLSSANTKSCDHIFLPEQIADFVQNADYLVNTLPLTQKTRQMFNMEIFKQMKPDAVLINVGRGDSVVEEDLVRALERGMLRGAVLDVFCEEPLSKESVLWKMPNVYLTPHCSAVSFPSDILRIFAENYYRFLSNQDLQYVVDFKSGY